MLYVKLHAVHVLLTVWANKEGKEGRKCNCARCNM